MEYYSKITRNKLLIHVKGWMSLENMLLIQKKIDTKEYILFLTMKFENRQSASNVIRYVLITLVIKVSIMVKWLGGNIDSRQLSELLEILYLDMELGYTDTDLENLLSQAINVCTFYYMYFVL